VRRLIFLTWTSFAAFVLLVVLRSFFGLEVPRGLIWGFLLVAAGLAFYVYRQGASANGR